MAKFKKKHMIKALAVIIDEIADTQGPVYDIWTSVEIKGKEYDLHYLYDEEPILYVYPILNGVRDENEIATLKLHTRGEGIKNV